MIIIRMRSGLGNQMFQYAFFKQMQQWHGNEKVKLDISTYHWNVHNGLELDRVFGIDLEADSVPASVSRSFADVGYRFQDRLLRRLRGIKHRSYRFWENVSFEEYRTMDDVYLEGFWNNEQFFAGVKDEIRATYCYRGALSAADQQLIQEMKDKQSVAIHVRRGDYKKYPKKFPMCTPDYYKQAIERVQREAENSSLSCFVFSDDLDWCKQELTFLPDVTFVDNPNPLHASKDMYLMSCCKHNVIANSTFSWWGAWLNLNPDKRVIYPESALLTFEFMPEGWQKL
ncbi:alpha-1,2-fucosyltransferase [Mangrovibacterium diazotrophicum]|uniref:Glycosyl transferase family 11 n=1 Tax=Mangrovibacterium diazotrophicum TaxID=1261403 RepID=A0A419WAS1_9BACT|nr:alpha-1,2-fucosyltransferase [Mangrovibacterium diazotrophicum]RKD92581.1 glycosyl transferase family 11 [Mangrovibacterium diazotrophicum]